MPVLPLVASTIVVRPGSIRPSRSAASIIAMPMRSLTEPPGLKASSLANSRAPCADAGASSRRVISTSGVRPISCATFAGTALICRAPMPAAPRKLRSSRLGFAFLGFFFDFLGGFSRFLGFGALAFALERRHFFVQFLGFLAVFGCLPGGTLAGRRSPFGGVLVRFCFRFLACLCRLLAQFARFFFGELGFFALAFGLQLLGFFAGFGGFMALFAGFFSCACGL